MDTAKIIMVLLGLLTTISIALGSFALKWQFEANADIAILQHHIEDQSEQAQNDLRHDNGLSKHWKLHSWAKDEINDLRRLHNLDSERWPELSN